VILLLALVLGSAHVQAHAAVAATSITGTVVDTTGSPIAGAEILARADRAVARAVSAADGTWTIAIDAVPPVQITVSSPGFADATLAVTAAGTPVRIELSPQAIAERITVTGDAERRLSIESSATILDRAALAGAPALALDDQLRVVPGFSLFRRTSSLVANPTTQGVTLRGMSASGASRTLVVAEGVPLNDPFGAWVYWDRVPVAALDTVTVSRGAASDVHGNDALGGVITLSLRTAPGVDVRIEGGARGTFRVSGYAASSRRQTRFGVAAESLRTDGYVVVAPESRGAIDVPAGVRAGSAMGWFGAQPWGARLEARGGYYSEDRGNGTPAQVNATISRWGAGSARGFLAGGAWDARVDSTGTSYRQTFSAVSAARTMEQLTRLQWVSAASTGGAITWLRGWGSTTALLSASTRYSSAQLQEAPVTGGLVAPVVITPAWQRSDGIAFQGRFVVSPRASLEVGARAEAYRSRLRRPSASESVAYAFDPRVTLSWQAAPAETLRVSWLSGFRGPTMNELYRSFRVGNAITLANADLAPERVWGPEAAFTSQHARWTARAIAYATHLTNAIYSRTLSSGETIMRQRSNAAARAIGSELEFEWRAGRGIALSTSWAIDDSRFTSGDLDGKRVPQVPRAQGTLGVRLSHASASAAVNVRIFSSQFDDDVNAFELGAGSLADARVGWRASRHLELFGAIENALDAEIDTGRTPIRTIGAPRTARVGLRLFVGG
jgi:outer membrane cobalamin receptor